MASIARLYQHVAALLASTGAFTIGVNIGWSSLVETSLSSSLDWEGVQVTRVISVLGVGACCGALLVCPILALFDRLPCHFRFGGSRAIACAGLPWLLIGWCILTFSNYDAKSYEFLLLGRFINGISVGILSVLVPLYISDVSNSWGRDALVCYYQVMLCLGILVSFGLAYKCFDFPEVNLSKFSKFCGISSLLGLLCSIVPSTPLEKLLVDEDDIQGAEKSLKRMNIVPEEDVQVEARRVNKMAKAMKEPWNKDLLLSREFYKALAVVGSLTICQQMSGAVLLLVNSQTMFGFVQVGASTSSYTSYLVSWVLVASSLLGAGLVHLLGRRTLLIFGSLVMGISNFIIGYLSIEIEDNGFLSEENKLFLYVLVVLYFGSFNFGTGTAPRSMLADCFPIQMRTAVASVITGLGWFVLTILNNNFATVLLARLTVHWTLWMFSGFSVLASAVGLFFARNYRGMSLTDLHEHLWLAR